MYLSSQNIHINTFKKRWGKNINLWGITPIFSQRREKMRTQYIRGIDVWGKKVIINANNKNKEWTEINVTRLTICSRPAPASPSWSPHSRPSSRHVSSPAPGGRKNISYLDTSIFFLLSAFLLLVWIVKITGIFTFSISFNLFFQHLRIKILFFISFINWLIFNVHCDLFWCMWEIAPWSYYGIFLNDKCNS